MELKDFIRRAAVLEQYRSLLRAARCMAVTRPDQAIEVKTQIREEFRRHRHETNPATIRMLLAHSKRNLDMILSLADSNCRESESTNAIVGENWPWERER